MNKKVKKNNPGEGRIEIRVKVVPRSSMNRIIGKEGDVYKVKITSPPVDGLANKTLIELFAKKLGVAKASVEIVSGHRSKLKMIRIYGISEEDIQSLLK